MTMGMDSLALIQDMTFDRLVCSLEADEMGSQGDEVWTAIGTTRTPKFLETISLVFNCMTSKVQLATCRDQVHF